MDKSDDSAAVRNGVYRLVDLIFRGQYIPKGALVIFDGLNKELCVGIHLVVIRIVHLGRKSGWLFCALYLKQAASSLMMAYGGDEFVHPDNAMRYQFISLGTLLDLRALHLLASKSLHNKSLF